MSNDSEQAASGGHSWSSWRIRATAAGILAAILVGGVLFLVLPGHSGSIKVGLTGNNPSGKQKAKTSTSTHAPTSTHGSGTTSNSKVPPLTIPAGETPISVAAAQALVKQAVSANKTAVYIASYKVTGKGQNESFTFAQDPPNSKLEFSQPGSAIIMEEFLTPSASYNCFIRTLGGTLPAGVPSLTPGKSLCIKGSAASSGQSPTPSGTFLQSLSTMVSHIGSQISKYKGVVGVLTQSTKTVDGIQMQCINIPLGGISACLTAQGILGYMTMASHGGGTIVLTSYSTNVPSGEFTLPSKPISQGSSSLSGTPASGFPYSTPGGTSGSGASGSPTPGG
ncbi:MAG: hypothetical protein ACYDGY_07625 [Acidimicrobiales bacterium]